MNVVYANDRKVLEFRYSKRKMIEACSLYINNIFYSHTTSFSLGVDLLSKCLNEMFKEELRQLAHLAFFHDIYDEAGFVIEQRREKGMSCLTASFDRNRNLIDVRLYDAWSEMVWFVNHHLHHDISFVAQVGKTSVYLLERIAYQI